MSDGPGYEANLVRGQLLRENGRFQDACKYLGDAIQADPEEPQKHMVLETIDRAVSLDPRSARLLGYKGYLLSHLGRHKEGLAVAGHALEIDPFCYIALLAHANAYTKQSQWLLAEHAARRMLEFNPSDISALNLLAQALRFQDRLKESHEVIAQILMRVPNDAFGQTNAGYEALKVNDYRRANGHFLTALRTDPHNDHARQGLLQSLRSRIWIFRVNFQILTLLSEERSKAQAALRVAFVILTVATGGIALLLVLLYLVLAFTLYPVSNLFLLLEPVGRRALTSRQRNWAVFTGLCAAVVLVALAFLPWHFLFYIAATYLSLFALGVYIPQWTDALHARREHKVLSPE
jgi:tetratricopeptide (TPR) repeat protein